MGHHNLGAGVALDMLHMEHYRTINGRKKRKKRRKRKRKRWSLSWWCPSSKWQWVPETRVPDGFYPIRMRVWNRFYTRGYVIGRNPLPIGYGGYGCGIVVPIPAYPWVRNTRKISKQPKQFSPYSQYSP